MSLSLFCVYTSEDEQRRFREAWQKSGKKLDMGKSCVRFRKIDDVPLDVIARTVKRITAKKFIANYESAFAHTRRSTKKTAKKTGKATAKKAATKTARRTTRKTTTRQRSR
jgi:hypothetical protein